MSESANGGTRDAPPSWADRRHCWWCVYALFPVLWILSLSLKPTSTVKDGKLIPSSMTFDNYKAIFTGATSSARRWSTRSASG